jgi:flavin-dependent dehydrogenase
VRAAGAEWRAAAVIDASGRRSPLSRWLAEVGGAEPATDQADGGFVYYARFFRRGATGLPAIADVLRPFGSISLLVLPDDAGWSLGVYTTSTDTDLRALRDPEVWTRVASAFPGYEALADGDAVSEGVEVMASHVGRRRSLVVDGAPVAEGVVAVGDAWACTNPSLGRGITLGVLHAVHTAEVVARHLDDPAKITLAWQEETDRHLSPWYDATVALDQARLEEMEAHRAGTPYEPTDPVGQISTAMRAGRDRDPEVYRMYLELQACLATAEDVLARDGAFEAIVAASAEGPIDPGGPDRTELLSLVGGR